MSPDLLEILLYHAAPGRGGLRPRRIRCTRVIPPVVVELGELAGLIYRTDKTGCGRPQTYIHLMRHPPLLVSDARGRRLFIVGGSYHVTGHGIEDGPAPVSISAGRRRHGRASYRAR
jgi:hypothetical protein